MRVAVVFNHPYEGSYNNAILGAVLRGLQNAGHEVDLMHMDNDGFNPAMSSADLKAFEDHKPVDPQVIDYCERLRKANARIFTFPLWWAMMPAGSRVFVTRSLA